MSFLGYNKWNLEFKENVKDIVSCLFEGGFVLLARLISVGVNLMEKVENKFEKFFCKKGMKFKKNDNIRRRLKVC